LTRPPLAESSTDRSKTKLAPGASEATDRPVGSTSQGLSAMDAAPGTVPELGNSGETLVDPKSAFKPGTIRSSRPELKSTNGTLKPVTPVTLALGSTIDPTVTSRSSIGKISKNDPGTAKNPLLEDLDSILADINKIFDGHSTEDALDEENESKTKSGSMEAEGENSSELPNLKTELSVTKSITPSSDSGAGSRITTEVPKLKKRSSGSKAREASKRSGAGLETTTELNNLQTGSLKTKSRSASLIAGVGLVSTTEPPNLQADSSATKSRVAPIGNMVDLGATTEQTNLKKPSRAGSKPDTLADNNDQKSVTEQPDDDPGAQEAAPEIKPELHPSLASLRISTKLPVSGSSYIEPGKPAMLQTSTTKDHRSRLEISDADAKLNPKMVQIDTSFSSS